MRTGPAPADNGGVRWFPFLARLASLGQHAGRAARMAAARGTAFTAAHRMADGIHRGAAVVGLAAHPAFAARLAEADIHVVRIPHGPNRGAAVGADAAHLAGRQSN